MLKILGEICPNVYPNTLLHYEFCFDFIPSDLESTTRNNFQVWGSLADLAFGLWLCLASGSSIITLILIVVTAAYKFETHERHFELQDPALESRDP